MSNRAGYSLAELRPRLVSPRRLLASSLRFFDALVGLVAMRGLGFSLA